MPEFSAYNIAPAMMHPNMNTNSMNTNVNVNRNRNMNMNPWGSNTRGMGCHRGMMARGGQLVVAGSVVGQWGANWGRGPGGAMMRGSEYQQRMRGNIGGRKVREKKGEEASKGNERVKILTKEKVGKENEEEADVVVEN